MIGHTLCCLWSIQGPLQFHRLGNWRRQNAVSGSCTLKKKFGLCGPSGARSQGRHLLRLFLHFHFTFNIALLHILTFQVFPFAPSSSERFDLDATGYKLTDWVFILLFQSLFTSFLFILSNSSFATNYALLSIS